MNSPSSEIAVTLLTGGFDRPYAFGLSMALVSKGVNLEVIGSKDLDGPEMHAAPALTFINLHGDQRKPGALVGKVLRQLTLYGKLFLYAATAKPTIFHVLWNNKFQLFDRTLLMLYYKLLGKKIVFTAHNVNAAERDGGDSAVNRLSLRIQYRLVDHIFVHTEKMKLELLSDFGIEEKAVSVIPFGVNNSVPNSELTPSEAKQIVGLTNAYKIILFFGNIRPYKGLEYLVEAFQIIVRHDERYRLIIAGEAKKDSTQYWKAIQRTIEREQLTERVILETRFIEDNETEIYFKAADVLVLPYTMVFQSGVLFLAYSFGLPVIATDVGSLSDDIVEGRTGYLCRSRDAANLATAITTYFASDLFRMLDCRRTEIKDYAHTRNSWSVVSNKTCDIYTQLLSDSC